MGARCEALANLTQHLKLPLVLDGVPRLRAGSPSPCAVRSRNALRGPRIAATSVMRASTRGATASRDSLSLRSAKSCPGCDVDRAALGSCSRAHAYTPRHHTGSSGWPARREVTHSRRRSADDGELHAGPGGHTGGAGVHGAPAAAIVPISGDPRARFWTDGERKSGSTCGQLVGPGFLHHGRAARSGRTSEAELRVGPGSHQRESFAAKMGAAPPPIGRPSRPKSIHRPEKRSEIGYRAQLGTRT